MFNSPFFFLLVNAMSPAPKGEPPCLAKHHLTQGGLIVCLPCWEVGQQTLLTPRAIAL